MATGDLQPIRKSAYHSIRTGKNPMSKAIDLKHALKLFKTLFAHFDVEGYFQQALGYECVDQGFLPGSLGLDLDSVLLLTLRKTHLSPISHRIETYAEDDLFDMVEFLFDHSAKPTKRRFHDWNQCGWHCEEFDIESGKGEFREKVNKILEIYSTGYELSVDGEVLNLAESGFEGLFDAPLPKHDPENVEARIESARIKFRRHRATSDDRREAVRELADVLEFLRPKLKTVLHSKDEADLFNIANNFGVRHHNSSQKTDFDKAIWLSWMFYYYLATLHAALRLLSKPKSSSNNTA